MVQSQLRVLLAQDPVHARILELVVENATAPDIAMYTKLNLIEHKASHQVSCVACHWSISQLRKRRR